MNEDKNTIIYLSIMGTILLVVFFIYSLFIVSTKGYIPSAPKINPLILLLILSGFVSSINSITTNLVADQIGKKLEKSSNNSQLITIAVFFISLIISITISIIVYIAS